MGVMMLPSWEGGMKSSSLASGAVVEAGMTMEIVGFVNDAVLALAAASAESSLGNGV